MIIIVNITWIALQLLDVLLGCVAVTLIITFILYGVETLLDRWKIKRRDKRRKKEHAKLVERWAEQELYRIEKRKYPLFYLKDGIV